MSDNIFAAEIMGQFDRIFQTFFLSVCKKKKKRNYEILLWNIWIFARFYFNTPHQKIWTFYPHVFFFSRGKHGHILMGKMFINLFRAILI